MPLLFVSSKLEQNLLPASYTNLKAHEHNIKCSVLANIECVVLAKQVSEYSPEWKTGYFPLYRT